MAEIADEEPLEVSDLRHYQSASRAWVVDDSDRIAGFLLAEPVDGRGHIAQVSVHPGAARRGLGRRLIEHLAEVASAAGPGGCMAGGLSLTTYRDVPWNAPYYRRLGFRELPERDWGPGLAALRGAERRAGLDQWPRVAMVRPNGGTR